MSGSMSYSQVSKQLVTYHGDSDEEDANSKAKFSDDSEPDNSEVASASASPILSSGGLVQFQRSSSASTSLLRNVLVRTRIQAAPVVSLVSYAREGDDSGSESEDEMAGKVSNDHPTSHILYPFQDDIEGTSPFHSDSPLPPGAPTTDIPTKSHRPPRVNLPPAPSRQCKPELQSKITNLLKKQRQRNIRLNESVQKRKDFRNPSIYEKLVTFLGLDELGSNFEHRTFDETNWGSDCYFDALGRLQKEQYDKKEKEKAKRTQVDFVSGSALKRPAIAPAIAAAVDAAKKRKSKWDMGSVGAGTAVKETGKSGGDNGANPLDAAKKAAMTIGLMHQPLRRK